MQDRLKFLREDLIRTETLTPLAVAAIYSWAFTQDRLDAVGRLVLLDSRRPRPDRLSAADFALRLGAQS